MNKSIKNFTLGQKLQFRFHLSRIVRGLKTDKNGYVPGYKDDYGTSHWFDCVNATEEQKQEAASLVI